MTIDAISYVLKCGINDPVGKLAFLALADNADMDGHTEVNYAHVADWACCQDEAEAETVVYCLEEKGFITVTNNGYGPIAIIHALAVQRIEKRTAEYSGRSVVPPKVRQNVYKRDGYTCHYCEQEMDEDDRTLDHIIPVSRGGQHTEDNLVVSCRSCNSKKGTKDYIEFIDLKGVAQ